MLYSMADMYCSARLKAEASKVIESLEFMGDGSNKLSGTVAVIWNNKVFDTYMFLIY